jgi:histidyl-tRNA synthetase
MNLSTQPYKGARDFYPEDMRIRNYIFETWKKVCRLYGFEEYDFPILENFEVFASKSGEEIVNTQLFSFEDRGGRKVAIRPELTPSTVRMLAGRYNELIRPVKWFMIGNNWRFEKPQKGRGREFYQLEGNIFGVQGVEADFEIMQLMIAIMKQFGANETMFSVKISDRRLITALLGETLGLSAETQVAARRLMDKFTKMEESEFYSALADIGVQQKNAEKIAEFMRANINTLPGIIGAEIVAENEGYKNITKLFEMLEKAGLAAYCEFDPGIIRGFDYSDGLVYEVFDKNPENRRSMFGGERFDRLIQVFGKYQLEATGFAMGDITLLEFLKGWNLLPEMNSDTKVMIAVFNNDIFTSTQIAEGLRKSSINTVVYLNNDKLDKQLKFADKKGIRYVVIPGEEEMKSGRVTLKDMLEKKQEVVEIKMLSHLVIKD